MAKLLRKEFIEKLAPHAIADMYKTKVPASLTIAQGILESADGNSELTIRGNNLFGIKGTGTAGTIALPTTEYINGNAVKTIAKFRMYHSWSESIADHSALFQNGVSWNRQLYRNVIGKDGITAAIEVAKAGYATDPKYAEKLINLINDNDLLQFDNFAPIYEEEKTKQTDSEKLIQLEKEVNELRKKMNTIYGKNIETTVPDWFNEEFPNGLELLNQKTGSHDFWRALAVIFRILKQYKII